MNYNEALELLKRIINESNNEQSIKNTMNNLVDMLDNRARKIDYIRNYVRLKCYDSEIKCCVHDLISNDCDNLLEVLQDSVNCFRKNECAVCKALEEKGEYTINGDWTVLEIKKVDDEIKIYAYGEGIASMKENYCSECGRKVGD